MSGKRPEIGLETADLAVSRGYRVLFRKVGFKVAPGEALELRGPNGSGKSTLLRILAGLTRAELGAVTFPGANDDRFRHYLGHADAIKPNETARQQAHFWARFLGYDGKAAMSALERVGLKGRLEAPGRGLSAGQKKRLALARLLIAPRPVWLLDEPMASLDADGATFVRELAAEHLSGGGLIVAAVHGDGFANARTLDISQFEPVV